MKSPSRWAHRSSHLLAFGLCLAATAAGLTSYGPLTRTVQALLSATHPTGLDQKLAREFPALAESMAAWPNGFTPATRPMETLMDITPGWTN
jgi:hypothetical protein